MQPVNRFFVWLKPSFEGKDGKASIRRLTAMVVLFLHSIARLVFTFTSIDPQYLFYALCLDSVFFCVLMGIILIQHLIEFKQGYRPEEGVKDEH